MKLLNMVIAVLLLCTLAGVVEADAAAKITVTQTAEGVYSVSVANVAKASALDFTITYDAAVLSNPVISNGPFAGRFGAMQVPHNDATRGTLRVAYLVTAKDVFFEGDGLLATVTFSKTGTVSPKLLELKSEVISDTGIQVAVESVVTPLPGTQVKTTTGGGDTADNTGNNNNILNPVNPNPGSMGGLPGVPGTSSAAPSTTSAAVTYQNPVSGAVQESRSQGSDSRKESSQEPPHQQEQSGGAAIQDGVASAAVDTAKKPVAKKQAESMPANLKSLESVAERFKDYKGPRTLKGLSELFDAARYKAAGVEQTPAIAVSDGKKMITVRIALPAGSAVPGFSLKGANLKGLRSLSDRSMELDALPQKGKLDVRMSIEIQKTVAEIPLLVVPPVSGGIVKQSDQELEKLLAKADARNKALLYDLNADGKQDYLDDYILVAHWLLKQQVDKKIPAAKTAVPR
ncbi:MAG: cohesin domain-containing protein [Geobacteraceae bacterium]|nr:cohesin domain-containing protein [Geobacteraceae bacterium]